MANMNTQHRKRVKLIISFVVVLVAAPVIAHAALYLDWADTHVVGAIWLDLKGYASVDVRYNYEYNGGTRPWEVIGRQNVSGKGNAEAIHGAFRRDRTGSDCADLDVYMYRHVSSQPGANHSIGSTCPEPYYYNWPVDGSVLRSSDTCVFADSDEWRSSRDLHLDHSGSSSSYLPSSGNSEYREYVVRTRYYWANGHGSYDYGDYFNCYKIWWAN
jgi:hypothetical protein